MDNTIEFLRFRGRKLLGIEKETQEKEYKNKTPRWSWEMLSMWTSTQNNYT